MLEAAILVKTYRGDRAGYIELQQDLISYGYRHVRVCVPGRDLALFKPVVSPGFELVSDEQVLQRFGHGCSLQSSWYSQQLLKLLLVAECEREICWVLDANTLLQSPLPDPRRDGRSVLALQHLRPEDWLWFHSSARFLGLRPHGPPMAPVNQPLRSSVVRRLLARIARMYACPPLVALVSAMRAGRDQGTPLWTEYGLYRSYAFHVTPSAHLFGSGRRVSYYNHEWHGARLSEWLRDLRRMRPHMVKVYGQRSGYRLRDDEIRRLCDRIRECR